MAEICPICGGTGFVDKGRTVEICSCRFQARDISKYLHIPPRFADAEFENYKPVSPSQREALSVCMSYAYSFDPAEGKGLTLLGPPHMGKTHLAVSILKSVYRQKEIRGLFFDTKDMLFKLRSVMEDNEKYTKLVNILLKTPLLVLDDLGSERLSDWQREIITHIISYRYNHMKSTIITTNYALRKTDEKEVAQTLEERLSEAVVSRIHQMNTILYIIP
ncbi:Primosomal protein DnaI [bacterium HR13]|nr:Primosomal protein DnaI [bacterium HR13]